MFDECHQTIGEDVSQREIDFHHKITLRSGVVKWNSEHVYFFAIVAFSLSLS
jgi:hypothetical protein